MRALHSYGATSGRELYRISSRTSGRGELRNRTATSVSLDCTRDRFAFPFSRLRLTINQYSNIWCGLGWMVVLALRSGAITVVPAAAWLARGRGPGGLVNEASLCVSVWTSISLASAASAELRAQVCRSHRGCVAAFTFPGYAQLLWCGSLTVLVWKLSLCARFCRPASACLRLNGLAGACGLGTGGGWRRPGN